jgi:hypothetical protein
VAGRHHWAVNRAGGLSCMSGFQEVILQAQWHQVQGDRLRSAETSRGTRYEFLCEAEHVGRVEEYGEWKGWPETMT